MLRRHSGAAPTTDEKDPARHADCGVQTEDNGIKTMKGTLA